MCAQSGDAAALCDVHEKGSVESMFIHTIHTNTQRKHSPRQRIARRAAWTLMTPRTRSQNAALQAREVKRAPLTDTSFTTHQHANDHTKHKKFTQSTKQRIEGGQPTLSTLITPRDVHIPFVSECHMREGQLNRIGIPCSCAAAAVQHNARTLRTPKHRSHYHHGRRCCLLGSTQPQYLRHASLTVKLITNRPRTARHGPPSTNHMVLD